MPAETRVINQIADEMIKLAEDPFAEGAPHFDSADGKSDYFRQKITEAGIVGNDLLRILAGLTAHKPVNKGADAEIGRGFEILKSAGLKLHNEGALDVNSFIMTAISNGSHNLALNLMQDAEKPLKAMVLAACALTNDHVFLAAAMNAGLPELSDGAKDEINEKLRVSANSTGVIVGLDFLQALLENGAVDRKALENKTVGERVAALMADVENKGYRQEMIGVLGELGIYRIPPYRGANQETLEFFDALYNRDLAAGICPDGRVTPTFIREQLNGRVNANYIDPDWNTVSHALAYFCANGGCADVSEAEEVANIIAGFDKNLPVRNKKGETPLAVYCANCTPSSADTYISSSADTYIFVKALGEGHGTRARVEYTHRTGGGEKLCPTTLAVLSGNLGLVKCVFLPQVDSSGDPAILTYAKGSLAERQAMVDFLVGQGVNTRANTPVINPETGEKTTLGDYLQETGITIREKPGRMDPEQTEVAASANRSAAAGKAS